MTRRSECTRFADLTDERAVGRALTADESRFLSRHVTTCADCRRQEALFTSLEHYGDDVREELASPSEKGGAPAGDGASLWRRVGPKRVAVVGIAAAAAGISFYLGSSSTPEVPPPNVAAAPSRARVVLAAGDAVASLQDAREDVPDGSKLVVESGRLCLRIDADVTACFDAATSAHLDLGAAGGRTLDLERGAVSIDVVPNVGRGLRVRTKHGAVDVVGTVFTVRADDAESRVGVSHGRVRVTEGGQTSEVAAGELLAFSAASVAQRSAYATSARDHDVALLRGADLYRDGESASFALRGASACVATLDGIEVGVAPLWIRVSPEERELSLGGSCARREVLHFGAGQDVVLLTDAPPAGASSTSSVPSPSADPSSSAAASAVPPSSAGAPSSAVAAPGAPASAALEAVATASDLLSRAQDLRRRGRGADALAAYEALTVQFPGSAEAHVARISVGQLKLATGNAAGALAEFERYASKGGALSLEAEAGRIACLRALGRVGDERSAIQSFLAEHPDVPQAAALRTRLGEIAPQPKD